MKLTSMLAFSGLLGLSSCIPQQILVKRPLTITSPQTNEICLGYDTNQDGVEDDLKCYWTGRSHNRYFFRLLLFEAKDENHDHFYDESEIKILHEMPNAQNPPDFYNPKTSSLDGKKS